MVINKKEEKYLIMKLSVHCSSGVYMRQLAEEIGQKFEIPSLAFTIKRTKIFLL
jgi:tRNA U55 pseudouridine synthase TruB